MQKYEFIEAIQNAGWSPTSDAQYAKITELWRGLFPYAAKLEDALNDPVETYCSNCDEELLLPEGTKHCPLCQQEGLSQ